MAVRPFLMPALYRNADIRLHSFARTILIEGTHGAEWREPVLSNRAKEEFSDSDAR
jgi:hypothetical protein